MKFTLAKQDADVALVGIKADIEWHDRSAKAITLTDAAGRTVRISKGESYGGLDILIPAPPVKVDRWRVSGQIPGINEAVLEYFETDYEAKKRVNEIDEAVRVEHELKVEKVNVTEDEAAAHAPKSLEAAEVAF